MTTPATLSFVITSMLVAIVMVISSTTTGCTDYLVILLVATLATIILIATLATINNTTIVAVTMSTHLSKVPAEVATSPESMDSSARQFPLSSTISQVALPLSSTSTSPGTSRREDTALHSHPSGLSFRM